MISRKRNVVFLCVLFFLFGFFAKADISGVNIKKFSKVKELWQLEIKGTPFKILEKGDSAVVITFQHYYSHINLAEKKYEFTIIRYFFINLKNISIISKFENKIKLNAPGSEEYFKLFVIDNDGTLYFIGRNTVGVGFVKVNIGFKNYLFAVNIATGKVKWKIPLKWSKTDAVRQLYLTSDTIICPIDHYGISITGSILGYYGKSDTGSVFVIDKKNGRIVYNIKKAYNPLLFFDYGNNWYYYLYFKKSPTSKGVDLELVNLNTLKQVWKKKVFSASIDFNDSYFFLHNSKRIACYNFLRGEQKWDFKPSDGTITEFFFIKGKYIPVVVKKGFGKKTLIFLDKNTGQQIFNYNFKSSVDNCYLFNDIGLVEFRKNIAGFDLKAKKKIWDKNAFFINKLEFVHYEGTKYIFSPYEHSLMLIDIKTGKFSNLFSDEYNIVNYNYDNQSEKLIIVSTKGVVNKKTHIVLYKLNPLKKLWEIQLKETIFNQGFNFEFFKEYIIIENLDKGVISFFDAITGNLETKFKVSDRKLSWITIASSSDDKIMLYVFDKPTKFLKHSKLRYIEISK